MTTALCPGVAPTTPGRTPTPGARRTAKAAALLAGGSAAAHGALLFTPGHGIAMLVPMAVMALLCAGCAVRTWRCQARRELLVLMFMSLGMALLHAAMVLGIPGQPGMHAMHDAGASSAEHLVGAVDGAVGAAAGAGAMAAANPGSGAGSTVMLAVIVFELAVAWAAGLAVRLQTAGLQATTLPSTTLHPRMLQPAESNVRRMTSSTTSSMEPRRS